MSPADDLLYVANPEYAPELLDFQTWGLDVLNPAKPDPGFPYWENLSWENADKYQPDLILWDGRSYTEAANAEWGKKQPTWFSIKAAKAGSVVAWPAYWLHTYGHFATELDKLTEAISTVDPAVGG
jgi:iron complex transport system substrate-binding protein